MKVYNLTDVATPALIQRGLVNVKIKVGSEVIDPGQSAEVQDSQEVRSKLSQYEGIGALSRAAPSRVSPPPSPPPPPPKAPEPESQEEERPVEEPVDVLVSKKRGKGKGKKT